jgi:hypothetical protein
MYEIIVFISLFTVMIAYGVFVLRRPERVDKYAKKHPAKYVTYHGIWLVSFITAALFLVSGYENKLVINSQELSTGYVYHIHQHSVPSFALHGENRKINEFTLMGEQPAQRYKMTEFTLREDEQIDTYILENIETKEQKTMKRLYDDMRIYLTSEEILDTNEKIEDGDVDYFNDLIKVKMNQRDWNVPLAPKRI